MRGWRLVIVAIGAFPFLAPAAEESADSDIQAAPIPLHTSDDMKPFSGTIASANPIRIVSLSERECVLNCGADVVSEGEVLAVFQPGNMMIDPDTKENLGYHEVRVGRIRVIRTDEHTSTADILEGADRMEPSFICRRERKTDPQPTEPAVDSSGE